MKGENTLPSYSTSRYVPEKHYSVLINEQDFNGYNSMTYVASQIAESIRFENYLKYEEKKSRQ